MIPCLIKNPFDPNEYIIWEEHGFEWVWVGMLKTLKPIRKIVGFETELFLQDCERLGLSPHVGEDGQIYSTMSFSL